jgi:hypothetical protein
MKLSLIGYMSFVTSYKPRYCPNYNNSKHPLDCICLKQRRFVDINKKDMTIKDPRHVIEFMKGYQFMYIKHTKREREVMKQRPIVSLQHTHCNIMSMFSNCHTPSTYRSPTRCS